MNADVKEGLTPDYVVGFVDGEGCFTIDRKGLCRFDVANTNKDIIIALKDYFGVGNIPPSNVKPKNDGYRRKPCYHFVVRDTLGHLKIIEFFDKHPLIVKSAVYKKWKQKVLTKKPCPRFKKEMLDAVTNLYKKGLTSKEIAKEKGLKESQVNHIKHRLRLACRAKYWTKKDKQKVCSLYQQGYTMKKLAQMFGRSLSSINHIIQRNTTFRKQAKV